jgi:hypothetical protein
VTENGRREERVVGWITDVIIASNEPVERGVTEDPLPARRATVLPLYDAAPVEEKPEQGAADRSASGRETV